jgi:recombination protein RecA
MSALNELLKKYQDVVQLGSEERPKTWFSLGPLSLNLAVGNVRGVQSGRIVQIVGKYSSGKSTLALDIVAQHQREHHLPVIYVDFERAYDRDYATAVGVDTSLIHIVRADSTEEGMTIMEKAIKTGDIKLVVIDSIAAAKPSSEDSKDYNDAQKMGGNSPISGRMVNRVVPLIDNNDVLVIVLNQLRANFNTMSPEREVPAGGKALHYATSVMIQTTNIKNTEDETQIQAVIKKNRVGAPRQVATFFIKYGQGIDHARDIIDLAIEQDIVRKSGSWISYSDKKVQGLERASVEFPIDEIRQRVIEAI